MGCRCNRIASVVDPIPAKHDDPVIINEPKQQPIRIKTPDLTPSDDHDEDHDQIIDLLIQTTQQTKTTDHFVDIVDADPQAFHQLFLQQRQQAIDNQSYRSVIHSWRFQSLQQLVDAIKDFTKNKSLIDCHWIIFYWITHNIQYDTVSYFSKNYANQLAENVFVTKKGVCAGYANLYKYICDYLNIPCDIVSGYSKGYGFEDRVDVPTGTDHAWNVVKVDQHWYLMESTWGAGSLNDQKAFKQQLNSYYFFPRPSEMIYHHLPENARWQLLRETMQMNQYLAMPKLHPTYFNLNLKLIYPCNQSHVELLAGKPYALVLVKAPSDVSLLASLELNGQKIEGSHQIIFDRTRRVHCCYFAPSTKGKHKINIYGKRAAEETGTHSVAISLSFDIQQMLRNPISYPKTWKSFFDLNLKVISPKNTHLIRLDRGDGFVKIVIQASDDVELLGRLQNDHKEEIDGGHQVYYDRRRRCWRCCFAPNDNGTFEADIMAKRKSDPGSYHSAVSFKIEANNIPKPPLSYPETWQLFHDLGLAIDVPQNRATVVWPNHGSFAEIRMEAPEDVLLSCSIEHNGVKEENGALAQYVREKKQWQLLFAPQRTG